MCLNCYLSAGLFGVWLPTSSCLDGKVLLTGGNGFFYLGTSSLIASPNNVDKYHRYFITHQIMLLNIDA